MLDFLKLFAAVLFLPLLPIIVCGLAVSLSDRLFMKLVGRSGRILILITSIVGTPIHELGHAIMCFPFGHKIRNICLWNPKAPGGVLGYVDHTYNKKNFWHRLGSLFISVGPIFLGLGVVTLIMKICFPSALSEYYASAFGADRSFMGIFEILAYCVKILPSAVMDTSMPIWAKIMGGILILCVCMHISLSPTDIKNSMEAIPFYALICLLISLTVMLIGNTARACVISSLLSWCFIGSALYMVVFAGVILILTVGFLFFIVRKIFGK